MNRSKSTQRGVTTVEFAIVGLLAFTMLFAALEVARLLFTVNMLEEATRRGARVAAVCPVDSPAINRAATFNSSGSGTNSPILPRLTTANIQVEYLNALGVPLTGYGNNQAVYLQIEYVRVSVANFDFSYTIPGFSSTFTTRSYATTLPRESLGVPRPGQTSICT